MHTSLEFQADRLAVLGEPMLGLRVNLSGMFVVFVKVVMKPAYVLKGGCIGGAL